MKYAPQYYGVKKYNNALYQCASEECLHFWENFETNEIFNERFFSFMKVVKSDWCGKLKEKKYWGIATYKVDDLQME